MDEMERLDQEFDRLPEREKLRAYSVGILGQNKESGLDEPVQLEIGFENQSPRDQFDKYSTDAMDLSREREEGFGYRQSNSMMLPYGGRSLDRDMDQRRNSRYDNRGDTGIFGRPDQFGGMNNESVDNQVNDQFIERFVSFLSAETYKVRISNVLTDIVEPLGEMFKKEGQREEELRKKFHNERNKYSKQTINAINRQASQLRLAVLSPLNDFYQFFKRSPFLATLTTVVKPITKIAGGLLTGLGKKTDAQKTEEAVRQQTEFFRTGKLVQDNIFKRLYFDGLGGTFAKSIIPSFQSIFQKDKVEPETQYDLLQQIRDSIKLVDERFDLALENDNQNTSRLIDSLSSVSLGSEQTNLLTNIQDNTQKTNSLLLGYPNSQLEQTQQQSSSIANQNTLSLSDQRAIDQREEQNTSLVSLRDQNEKRSEALEKTNDNLSNINRFYTNDLTEIMEDMYEMQNDKFSDLVKSNVKQRKEQEELNRRFAFSNLLSIVGTAIKSAASVASGALSGLGNLVGGALGIGGTAAAGAYAYKKRRDASKSSANRTATDRDTESTRKSGKGGFLDKAKRFGSGALKGLKTLKSVSPAGIAAFLGGSATDLVGNAASSVGFDTVGKSASVLGTAIQGAAIGGTAGSVIPGLGTIGGAILGGASGLGKGIKDTFLSDNEESTNTESNSFFESFKQTSSNVLGKLYDVSATGITKLKETGTQAIDKAMSSETAQSITNKAKETIDEAKSNKTVESISNKASNTVDSITSKAKKTVDQASSSNNNQVDSISNKVRESSKETVDQVSSSNNNQVDSIANKVRESSKETIDQVNSSTNQSSVADKSLEVKTASIFGINEGASLSSLFDKMKNSIKGFIDFMNERNQVAMNFFSRVPENLTNMFNNVKQSISTTLFGEDNSTSNGLFSRVKNYLFGDENMTDTRSSTGSTINNTSFQRGLNQARIDTVESLNTDRIDRLQEMREKHFERNASPMTNDPVTNTKFIESVKESLNTNNTNNFAEQQSDVRQAMNRINDRLETLYNQQKESMDEQKPIKLDEDTIKEISKGMNKSTKDAIEKLATAIGESMPNGQDIRIEDFDD